MEKACKAGHDEVPQDLSKARDLYLEAQAGGFPIDVNPDNL